MMRPFFLCVFLFAASALPLTAKDFQWSPQGDGVSFSDPGNWYDLDPAADPHNPSGPPGGGDSAELISGANVSAADGAVRRLIGTGTARLTISGTFTAQEVDTRLMLAGTGTLAGTNVTSAPVVEGGHLTALTFSDRAISVSDGGSVEIAGPVHAQLNDTVNLFVVRGATLSIAGDATDLSGAVEGGAHATLLSLSNVNTTKPTLSIGGAGSRLDISGLCLIRDGSLDVNSGAKVNIAGQFSLVGSATSNSSSSAWKGNGTIVTASDMFFVGGDSGSYTVNITDGAQASMENGAAVAGATAAGEVVVSGAESSWLVAKTLVVGGAGKGTLSIGDDGFVTTDGFEPVLSIGVEAGSEGIVTIDGSGSEYLSGGSVSVAEKVGSKGTVRVTNSGQFNLLLGTAGVKSLIIGAGGEGNFTVGNRSLLTVTDSDATVVLGQNAGSSGTLLVGNGAGPGIAVLGFATVGSRGIGLVNAGAQSSISSNILLIAESPVSQGTVTIFDGASWLNDGTVFVGGLSLGLGGGTGRLTVRDNGELRTARLFVSKTGIANVKSAGVIGVGVGPFGPAGTVRVVGGGELFGEGTVEGNVIVGPGGVVAPGASPGTLTIDGDYESEPGGELVIEIGGDTAGTDSDLLKITGTATLSGTLRVKLINGFTPAEGQTFKVLEAVARAGKFTQVIGAVETYTGTSISVEIRGPSLADLAGGFRGLALASETPLRGRAGAANPEAGLLTVKLTGSGRFSAKLILGKKVYPFKGKLDTNGMFTGQVRAGGAVFDVTLAADITSGSGTITGAISLAGVSYDFALDRATFNKKSNIAPEAGAYTILFPPNVDNSDPNAPRPQGTGWATASVKTSGKVKIAGRLADGSAFSSGGALAPDGSFDAFARPYKKLGIIAGALTFAAPPRDPDPATSDVTGTVRWTKPAQAKGAFPKAFDTTIEATGSAYIAPGKNDRVLPELDAAGEARLTFTGGGLAGAAAKDIVISTKNKVTYPGPSGSDDKLALKFVTKTGAFSGKFSNEEASSPAKFSGVVLQKPQRGGGFFVGTADSGTVDLSPRP